LLHLMRQLSKRLGLAGTEKHYSEAVVIPSHLVEQHGTRPLMLVLHEALHLCEWTQLTRMSSCTIPMALLGVSGPV
jgi:hypothetical protein